MTAGEDGGVGGDGSVNFFKFGCFRPFLASPRLLPMSRSLPGVLQVRPPENGSLQPLLQEGLSNLLQVSLLFPPFTSSPSSRGPNRASLRQMRR